MSPCETPARTSAPLSAEELLDELREIHAFRARITAEGRELSFTEVCERELRHAGRIPLLAASLLALPRHPALALDLARTGLADPRLLDAYASYLAHCELEEAPADEILSVLALSHLRFTELALESAPPHAAEVARAYRRRLRPGEILPTLYALTTTRPAFGPIFAEVWADDPEHTPDTLLWSALELLQRPLRIQDPECDRLAPMLLERALAHPACTTRDRLHVAALRYAHHLPMTDVLAHALITLPGRSVRFPSSHISELAAALELLDAAPHPPPDLAEILPALTSLGHIEAARTAVELLT